MCSYHIYSINMSQCVTLTSLRKLSRLQDSNFRLAKSVESVILHSCCIWSKLSWVTLPSGKSNAFIRVRIFLKKWNTSNLQLFICKHPQDSFSTTSKLLRARCLLQRHKGSNVSIAQDQILELGSPAILCRCNSFILLPRWVWYCLSGYRWQLNGWTP